MLIGFELADSAGTDSGDGDLGAEIANALALRWREFLRKKKGIIHETFLLVTTVDKYDALSVGTMLFLKLVYVF
jgi:hypothetical protein